MWQLANRFSIKCNVPLQEQWQTWWSKIHVRIEFDFNFYRNQSVWRHDCRSAGQVYVQVASLVEQFICVFALSPPANYIGSFLQCESRRFPWLVIQIIVLTSWGGVTMLCVWWQDHLSITQRSWGRGCGPQWRTSFTLHAHTHTPTHTHAIAGRHGLLNHSQERGLSA